MHRLTHKNTDVNGYVYWFKDDLTIIINLLAIDCELIVLWKRLVVKQVILWSIHCRLNVVFSGPLRYIEYAGCANWLFHIENLETLKGNTAENKVGISPPVSELFRKLSSLFTHGF